MKKILPLLAILIALAGCTAGSKTGPHFTKSNQEVNSPYEGYTIREGKLVSYQLLDRGKFNEDEEEAYNTCKADKSLRNSQQCPTFQILTFEPTDGKDIEKELFPTGIDFFNEEDNKALDLGCYVPEDEEGPAILLTSSYDEKKANDDNYSIVDEETEDKLLSFADTDKPIKLKFSKTPYNMAADHSWDGCESLVTKLEIVK